MGVTGLWRLIEPAGKPVPVETLENKVLAVDISIWLHQMVKGYQDAKGAPLPNAHLMGLFQRLCKLLYFRIKPVFVFDGGVPDLKRQTIAKRQDNKSKYNSESERLKRELALLIGKKTVVGALLGKEISPKKINTNQNDEDIFKLPAIPQNENESDMTESEDEDSSSASTIDLHTVDLESEDFKNMPSKEKYDLLLELKETRKMNSWGKLHTLPKKSDNFSDFQMQRLLKRRKVQECIEETEKEMGDIGMSLNDLESFLNEEGIDTKIEEIPTRRIASDQTTRFLLINNVKQTLSEAKKLKEQEAHRELDNSETDNENVESKVDELEDDLQRAIKMSLECVEDPGASTSASTSKGDESWTSYNTDSDYSDDDQDEFEPPAMSSAKAYIMQYSDFTHKAIDGIVSSKNTHKNKVKENTVDEIIAELNQEKSIIEDIVEITSEEELTNELSIDIKHSDIIKCKMEDPILNKKENKAGEICINKMCDKYKTIECDTNIEKKESSLICMEKSNENIVINLDTTSEENIYLDNKSKLSSSSDDEFEDVSESEKPSNPVVQLTLNLEDKIEDDIFADVFEHNKETHNKSKELPLASKKENHKIREMQVENESKVQTTKDVKSPTICNKILERDPSNVLKMELVKESKETIDVEKRINNKDPKSENIQTKSSNNYYSESSTNCAKQDIVQFEKSEETTRIIDNEVRKTIDTPVILSTEKLQSMEKEMENEQNELLQEKGRLDRIGRNISEQMTYDAQELLRVFGIPYIVAPMEAEAQCAFLESAKLTDGTITDDSDIWLFGGKTVYKNFFNQKKHVLQFLSERIERSYNLTREQLVLLALLVGSDYTTGVTGVGPVTALEILASFPFNNKKFISETTKEARCQQVLTGLRDFKQWVRAGKRTDNVTLKKKLKNVKLNDDFPSVRVVQAYLEPNVEKSEEKITWGEIDITILRDYTKDKFGWSQNKLDEIIKPVLKRMLDKKNQKTVHDYFKRKIDFQSLDDQMSKRVKAAVKKMDPNVQSDTKEEVNLDKNKKVKTGRKRKLETTNELRNISEIVKVTTSEEKKHDFNFIVPKTDTRQELIPQKEKVKQNLLENKLKAIEIFRKTKIDRKRKFTKKKSVIPKDQAELSESSDSD